MWHAFMQFLAGAIVLPGALVVGQAPATKAPSPELRLDVFTRGDSEICREAAAYARDFESRRNGIRVAVYDVLEDKSALARFRSLAKRYAVDRPELPAFYAYDRLVIGFGRARQSAAAIDSLFDVEIYVREGCAHCRDAKAFLAKLARRWPGIRVRAFDAIGDVEARRRMFELTRQAKKTVTGLPVIYVCGHVVVGYQTDATTGRQIERLLERAATVETDGQTSAPISRRDAPIAIGRGGTPFSFVTSALAFGSLAWAAADEDRPSIDKNVDAAVATTAKSIALPSEGDADIAADDLPMGQEPRVDEPRIYGPPLDEEPPTFVELPLLGRLDVRDVGLPLFTMAIGLVDGFNPCAMWVLVFLLSVLVNVRSRTRVLAVAGSFVAISGLAYFAFMAAWLNMFLLVGVARPLEIALGVVAIFIGLVNVKDFFFFKKGLSLSIPESAKPGIYARVRRIVTAPSLRIAIGAAIVLAILVNVVELLCTAGLPALYTEILTFQMLPAWKNYAYLALYILMYMLDDSVLLAMFVITLSRRKMQETEGRILKLVSGLVILALGSVMLFAPDWLHWNVTTM